MDSNEFFERFPPTAMICSNIGDDDAIFETTLYKAEDVDSGKPLVLKTTRLKISEKDKLLFRRYWNQILQERDILRALEGLKGVVQPVAGPNYFVDEENHMVGVAMECVEGEPLDARVRDRGCLSHQEWVRLAIDFGNIMQDIHSKRVLHRDLSPRNIFMTNSGPKLIDFGSAYGSWGVRLGAIYTPGYGAPELKIGGRSITPNKQLDIYSYGAVLHFAATGQAPLLHEIGEGIPSEWRTWLAGCLAEKPSERYRTFREVLNSQPKKRRMYEC